MSSYGKVDFSAEESAWIIRECAPHVAIRLKNLFPRIPTYAVAPFALPDSQIMCTDLAWFLDRYPMDISKANAKRLKQGCAGFLQVQAQAEHILLPDWQPGAIQGLREGKELRFYQQQAVSMIELVRRLLVVDDVGLGKTVEAIAAALLGGAIPAAFVVQSHLPAQWANKIKEFSHLTVHEITKTKPYDLPKADVYVFKYTQLAGWVDIFAQGVFKLVGFDEIQELRHGTKTGKGSGAKVLADHADFAFGLTATPIYNYGDEIFNVVDLVRPGALGSQSEFLREWCKEERRVKDPKALGAFLRENNIMLRRTKKDVGMEMAPVNTLVEEVAYDQKAVKDTEDLAKQLAMRAMTGSYMERGSAARELDMRVRQATGVSKARNVAAYVRMLVESGEPVLLAGWHREVYSIWMEELKDLKPLLYTGSETGKQKDRNAEAFINGETDLMIISLRSGAGLDGLQHRCSTVVIGELDWSPKVHEQLIGRLDRDGQKDPVMAIYVVSDYGSDPVIIDMLGIKSSQSDGILNPDAALATVNSDRSKLERLAEAYLGKGEVARLKAESGAQKGQEAQEESRKEPETQVAQQELWADN